MTTIDQPELNFPSAPIEGDTKATVDAVARGQWLAEQDWNDFEWECRDVAKFYGVVDPNLIRARFTNHLGELSINPRRLSAFWARATSKHGFMDNIDGPDGWTVNTDTAGGNAGKPIRLRRLRPSP